MKKDQLIAALEASQANKGVQPLTADPASGSAQAYQQMNVQELLSLQPIHQAWVPTHKFVKSKWK